MAGKLDGILLQRQRSYKATVQEVSKLEEGFETLLAISAEAKRKNQIPRIIHKIWWQGLDGLPEKYKQPLESWRMINPEWLIVIWDEKAIFNMMKEFYPRYEALMNDYPYMIQKIDAAKYFFLEKFGGMYSDMDQFCLRAIEQLIDPETEKADLVCSLLTEKRTMVMMASSFKLGSGPYINNAFCICKPEVEVWEDVRHKLASKRHGKGFQNKEIQVLNTTGPVLFTKGIKNAIEHEKNLTGKDTVESVRLIESKYIDPYSIYFKIGKEKNFEKLLNKILEEDEALCISFLNSSWTNSLDAWYTPMLSNIVHYKHRKVFGKKKSNDSPSSSSEKIEKPHEKDHSSTKWFKDASAGWLNSLGLSKEKTNSLLGNWKKHDESEELIGNDTETSTDALAEQTK
eukprot:CAMPEP_0204866880 /NCGR_PEP_ID=MMETSP1348-20121228/19677_1 /ASSEMBLY_ACC=CAM_ASM_000700 /TAXON_ID=215587 /ORGANISM="Aplanochytrium stocchinoi, Strain GSBS06" /LENGTH=399 /DNA_ID=CAMNT_0052018987 /DNA_START=131 /DNA_END=1330 /DNA_ORIENTATION=+